MFTIGRCLAVVIGTAFALTGSPAHADKRVALVIGNGAYAHAPHLPNPPHDAEDAAAALKRTGFETILGVDLDKASMDAAAISFARAARTADVAVFYYSGHAMQYAGVNYLLPIDAQLSDEADLRRMARVDEILADLQQAKNLRILVLNSCRDNPLADELKRSIGRTRSASIARGLARMESADGTIISYSTQAGRTAEDGDGRNSPYTTAFLKHIEDKDEITAVFHRISADVYETTRGTQVPELSLSFFGEFYLNGKLQTTVAPATAPAAPNAPVVVTPEPSEAERAWVVIKNTTSQSVLEDFIRQFGGTVYGNVARARLDELKKSQVAVAAPPVEPRIVPPVSAGPCAGGSVTVALSLRPACPLSAAEERALKPKDGFRECDACPLMVVVPAGAFTMGSPDSEKDRGIDEGPQHVVTFRRPFAVGSFAVTVDQFSAFVKETGHDTGTKCWIFEGGKAEEREDRSWRNPGFAQNGSHPASCLNWNDAKAYVAWLSKKIGKDYRLLTEAEYEYATRARTTPGAAPRYFFGDDEALMCGYGNGADQTAKNAFPNASRWTIFPCSDGYAYTAPVGSFAPNGFGLYDMHGNVSEWTEDCYHDSYAGAPSDGSAWTGGDCLRRELRDGSWTGYPRQLRAADRYKTPLFGRSYLFGFRVARTLLTP